MNWYQWEKELITKLSKEDEGFNRLYTRHQELEKRLKDLAEKGYLTAHEELEVKSLKKEKLRIRDKIEEFLKIRKVVIPA